jgi:hypothetical protein
VLLINTLYIIAPSNPLIGNHSRLCNLLFCAAAAHRLTLCSESASSSRAVKIGGFAALDLQVGYIADGEISGMERRVLGF